MSKKEDDAKKERQADLDRIAEEQRKDRERAEKDRKK